MMFIERTGVDNDCYKSNVSISKLELHLTKLYSLPAVNKPALLSSNIVFAHP